MKSESNTKELLENQLLELEVPIWEKFSTYNKSSRLQTLQEDKFYVDRGDIREEKFLCLVKLLKCCNLQSGGKNTTEIENASSEIKSKS